MPLFSFNYAADGSITKDPETGTLDHERLTTEGEISDADNYAPNNLVKEFGTKHLWLHAVFTQNARCEDESLNDYKRELAAFLSENMQGPYYVNDDAADSISSISLVLLDKADIERFKDAYPDWSFRKDSIAENAETLTLWRSKGRTLEDKSLYNYASMRLN